MADSESDDGFGPAPETVAEEAQEVANRPQAVDYESLAPPLEDSDEEDGLPLVDEIPDSEGEGMEVLPIKRKADELLAGKLNRDWERVARAAMSTAATPRQSFPWERGYAAKVFFGQLCRRTLATLVTGPSIVLCQALAQLHLPLFL